MSQPMHGPGSLGRGAAVAVGGFVAMAGVAWTIAASRMGAPILFSLFGIAFTGIALTGVIRSALGPGMSASTRPARRPKDVFRDPRMGRPPEQEPVPCDWCGRMRPPDISTCPGCGHAAGG